MRFEKETVTKGGYVACGLTIAAFICGMSHAKGLSFGLLGLMLIVGYFAWSIYKVNELPDDDDSDGTVTVNVAAPPPPKGYPLPTRVADNPITLVCQICGDVLVLQAYQKPDQIIPGTRMTRASYEAICPCGASADLTFGRVVILEDK